MEPAKSSKRSSPASQSSKSQQSTSKTTTTVSQPTSAAPAVAKSVLRKIAKLVRDKENKKERLVALEALQNNRFVGDKRVLLDQSGLLGNELTHAEELARLFARQEIGLDLAASEQLRLENALADYGDIESANRFKSSEERQFSHYQQKTMTSNPFKPLSSSQSVITSTLQDTLLQEGKLAEHKKLSKHELAKLASTMHVVDFEDGYKKKLKKRQRREEHHIIHNHLREQNQLKIHERKQLEKKQAQAKLEAAAAIAAGDDAPTGSSDDTTLPTTPNEQNEELVLVLPQELAGLSAALEASSSGKVKVITSRIAHAQKQRADLSQPQQESVSTTKIDSSMLAAASLISKGLLTNKTKNKLDALFAVDSVSSSESDDDDVAATDDDSVDDAAVAAEIQLTEEEKMWGVTAPVVKTKKTKPATTIPTKITPSATKKSTEKEKPTHEQQQQQQSSSKKPANALLTRRKQRQQANDQDEVVSAAVGSTSTAPSEQQQQQPTTVAQSSTASSSSSSATPSISNFESDTLKTTQQLEQMRVSQALAMPTIVRTTKAAAITQHMPIALVANNSTVPTIVIRPSKRRAAPVQDDGLDTILSDNDDNNLDTIQSDDDDEFSRKYGPKSVQKDEYAVNFAVIKSADMRALGNDDHDMSEDQYLEHYLRFNTHNTTDYKPQNATKKVKKRRTLFDLSQPVVQLNATSTTTNIQPENPPASSQTASTQRKR